MCCCFEDEGDEKDDVIRSMNDSDDCMNGIDKGRADENGDNVNDCDDSADNGENSVRMIRQIINVCSRHK